MDAKQDKYSMSDGTYDLPIDGNLSGFDPLQHDAHVSKIDRDNLEKRLLFFLERAAFESLFLIRLPVK